MWILAVKLLEHAMKVIECVFERMFMEKYKLMICILGLDQGLLELCFHMEVNFKHVFKWAELMAVW